MAHGTRAQRARAHLGPIWPYAVLIGIPAATFILPDLLGGHLLMSGDNLQQNYPLHVLVGSMLRHGQLPFWNPYIFSGTPLLAGFNAGAFYPLVGLFAILPDRVAWIATEVVLFSIIAVGMYLFLRALALSTAACVLAAATFSFSGVVLSQVNHVDMTEGFASIPFMLLAVLHIVRDGRWRWSVLLGVAFALVIFGGAPEAMLDEAALVIAYAALSAGFDRGRWWRVITRCGTGAALALSLAAVQWLPGLAAISNSQRSGLSITFAASGSYPPSDGLLSLVPYLYGGYRMLGENSFFSHYNLPEVGIYMGILPIVALLSLWRPQWPSRLDRKERLIWYGIGLFGLLLALGGYTPLEHLLHFLPLYGDQRLQSRNMIDVSVAASVLFAGWIDRRADVAETGARFDRWVALIPFGAVAGLSVWAIVNPHSLITTLTTGGASPSEVHTVREATFTALGFCLVAGVIVWLRPVVRIRHWIIIVSVFMAADLGLIAATSQLAFPPSNAVLTGDTAVERYVAAHLAPGGRFDVYDPEGYAQGPNDFNTGIPDDNVLARLPSIGGYASIVSGDYNERTLTHDTGELNVPLLSEGNFDQLDLQDIVTAPDYFLLALRTTPTSLDEVEQVSEGVGQDPVLPLGIGADFEDSGYSSYPSPRGQLVAGQVSAWFYGESIAPTQASVLLTPAVACGWPAATRSWRWLGPAGRLRPFAPAPGRCPRGGAELRAGRVTLRRCRTRGVAATGAGRRLLRLRPHPPAHCGLHDRGRGRARSPHNGALQRRQRGVHPAAGYDIDGGRARRRMGQRLARLGLLRRRAVPPRGGSRARLGAAGPATRWHRCRHLRLPAAPLARGQHAERRIVTAAGGVVRGGGAPAPAPAAPGHNPSRRLTPSRYSHMHDTGVGPSVDVNGLRGPALSEEGMGRGQREFPFAGTPVRKLDPARLLHANVAPPRTTALRVFSGNDSLCSSLRLTNSPRRRSFRCDADQRVISDQSDGQVHHHQHRNGLTRLTLMEDIDVREPEHQCHENRQTKENPTWLRGDPGHDRPSRTCDKHSDHR
jgi:hypothetical protein